MTDTIINIKTLIDETKRGLTDLRREQYPYALAKTLTDVAKGSASLVRKETASKFKLHGDFIPKGIAILSAKKSDVRQGVGHSVVFTKPIISGFMPTHESGGTRMPSARAEGGDRGRAMAIPTSTIQKKSYRLKTGQVKKSYKPSVLMHGYAAKNRKVSFTGGLTSAAGSESRKRSAFIIKGKGSGIPMIVRRKTRRQYPLELLYILSRRAKYNAVWGFESSVKEYVTRAFQVMFSRNMRVALRTAKS